MRQIVQILCVIAVASFAVAQSVTTTGNSGPLTTGSMQATSDVMAVFSHWQKGVLTAETAVSGSPSIRTGRFIVDVQGPLRTAVAFANPNAQSVSVTFFVSDSFGTNSGSSTFTIPPNGQIARFVDELSLNVGNGFTGTLTFDASLPVALTALRTLVNERSDFLMSGLPVIDLSVPVPIGTAAVVPHFANGGGWTTELSLMNATDERSAGNVQVIGTSGQLMETLPYILEPTSAVRLRPSNVPALTQTGSVRIVPTAGNRTPAGVAILSYMPASTRITELSVPVVASDSEFRLFVESDQNFGIQSGYAIANLSTTAVPVNLEWTDLSGVSVGRSTATLAGSGQTSALLALPARFEGMLRVSTDPSFKVSAIGVRKRINERGEPLFSAYRAVAPSPVSPMVLPHFIMGAEYLTQFVSFTTTPLQFFSPSGVSLPVSLFDINNAKAPTLQLVYPDVLFPGTALSLTLSGDGFVPGRTRVSVSGSGMSVSPPDTIAGNSITATFAADSTAPLGNRDVTVTSTGGVSNSSSIRVVNVVTAATPAEVTPGQTTPITVVAYFESIQRYWLGGIAGVQFQTNGVNDPAITLSNVQIQGDVVTAVMNVGNGVVIGPHTIVLVTPSGNVPTLGTLTIRPI